MATFTKFLGLPVHVEADKRWKQRKFAFVHAKIAIPNIKSPEDLKLWEKILANALKNAKA